MEQQFNPFEKRRKTIAGKVIGKMAINMLIVNVFVLGSIAYWTNYLIETGENKYMAEVITRVSGELNYEMARFVDGAVGISQNAVLRDYLEELQTIPKGSNAGKNAMLTAENYERAVAEMSVVSRLYGDIIQYVAVGSLAHDNAIDHLGGYGGDSYSLSSSNYFHCTTSQSTVISDAYTDHITGVTLVSVAHPIYDEYGTVIGLVTLDLAVDKLADILTAGNFGETGTTFVLDNQDNLLIAPGMTNISNANMGSMSFTGDSLSQELANPTGSIFKYETNGTKRFGGVQTVPLTGWKLISGIDVEEFQTRSHYITAMLTVMQIVAIALVMTRSAFDINKKLRPIRQLESYMEEVAEGNLHSPLDYDSDDEIGGLADYIRYTTQSLSSYIDHIADTMIRFGQGNFQLKNNVEYKGDFRAVHQAMEQFEDLMSASLSELQRAVDEVGSGAHQVASGAQVLAAGSTEQAQSVSSLHSLISGINTSIVDTAQSSSGVSTTAKNISDDLLVSNEKMSQVVVSVQDIKSMSEEVTRIIKAIEEVAFQTNILALNAAVEAARAGQSGRGFAVVADEVRNLSLKTAEAVDDTTKIITKMTEVIESGTDLALVTSKDLQGVVDEVERFVENISDISLSAQGQANAIVEINEGIDLIAAVVNKNSAVSEQSAAASQELSSQSTLMMDLIQKFKLK